MEKCGKIVVCTEKGADMDMAKSVAGHIDAPLTDKMGEELTLLFNSEGITLCGYGLKFRGDFENMLRRVTNGRLQHEMLVHVAKTKKPMPKAIDATAGMGEDSFLLAAYGYEVTMYEQNPVIAALLKDALRRAKKHSVLGVIASRMKLIEGDSIRLLKEYPQRPDIIYLDPMFPARQKSGLINKKLQLIQKLEQPCIEEEALLGAAISLKPEKIIIKRPLKGEYLAGKKAGYSVKGKAIRYDCIVP